MAKCKCGTRSRIVSDVVRSLDSRNCNNPDVCANPICGDPSMLGIMAPVVYDEIGINLCTTFDLGVNIGTEYPTAVSASLRVIGAEYEYGDGNVMIEAITGRPNCYVVTLSNITVQFAMNLYDTACRLLGTIYPTALYLPSASTEPTYDEDTNPSQVELELFAPYGISYSAEMSPMIHFVGFTEENNYVSQGLNLYGMAKLLDFNTDDSQATVGVTLALQSLYFAGYKVPTAGKIDIPKGSILSPDNSDCMRFVAGDLLNLAIKPLELGEPLYEEKYKLPLQNSSSACGSQCSKNPAKGKGGCADGGGLPPAGMDVATDQTVVITEEQ